MGAVWLGNAVRQGAAGVVRGVTDGVWGPVLDEGLVPAVAAVVGRPSSDAAESVGLVRIRIWGASPSEERGESVHECLGQRSGLKLGFETTRVRLCGCGKVCRKYYNHNLVS